MDAQRDGAAGKSTDGLHCCCKRAACKYVEVSKEGGSLCVHAGYDRPARAIFLPPFHNQPLFGNKSSSSHSVLCLG